MCRWIIHNWSIWPNCIIHTSGCHPLPLYHHWNFIFGRPNYFCLRHLQWLSEYHFTLSCRNSISKFTTSIPGTVQNKKSKEYISLNESEGTIYSGNKINSRIKTCWKILVWLPDINICHCKNYQKLFWPCCLIMRLQELQIIPYCWNRWNTPSNKE